MRLDFFFKLACDGFAYDIFPCCDLSWQANCEIPRLFMRFQISLTSNKIPWILIGVEISLPVATLKIIFPVPRNKKYLYQFPLNELMPCPID